MSLVVKFLVHLHDLLQYVECLILDQKLMSLLLKDPGKHDVMVRKSPVEKNLLLQDEISMQMRFVVLERSCLNMVFL